MGEEESSGFVCPNCDAPVEENWAACPACGTEFGPAEEAAPPAPPPPVVAPPREAPPARAPPPSKPPAAPPSKGKSSKGGKASKPPKGSKSPRRGGVFANWPVVGAIARRVGTLGVIGLGLMIAGLLGYFLVSNYDTLIAGRTESHIGENQEPFVMMMALAAAAGGGLTILGLFTARGAPARGSPMAYDEMEGTEARADVPVSAPARTVTSEVRTPPREPAPYAPPPARAAPAPTAVVAEAPADDDDPFAEPIAEPEPEVEEEAEDEIGEIELPSAPPEREQETEAVAVAQPASTSSADELEDLFGELESEVQSAVDDEEVLYECPNCHGVVKEEDSSCPHCHVVFDA